MGDVLRISGLVKHYGGFNLGPIDLTVEDGCVTGLIGRNGAGKTTTIKAMLGLIRREGGSIGIFGEDVGPSGPTGDAKQRIGVVFDTVSFPGEVRVEDVGSMGRIAYQKWDARRFEALSREFDLSKGKLVKDLSRGMGMKLSLAFAMCHGAELLVLDEPTAGLDPMARNEILDMLRDFMAKGGKGILLSSHITTDLEKVADVVTCIDEGKVAFSLPKDDICFAAGIARLRPAELDEVEASGFFEKGCLRAAAQTYGMDVLVPDRRAFATRFPEFAVEAASIEKYMELMLKGELR